jgi:hypothetical protein
MGNQPKKKFKAGGVAATIWENERTIEKDGKKMKVIFETVTVERNYKDGEQWKKTSTFRKNDLPKVMLVAQKAFEEISLNKEDDEIQIPEIKI